MERVLSPSCPGPGDVAPGLGLPQSPPGGREGEGWPRPHCTPSWAWTMLREWALRRNLQYSQARDMLLGEGSPPGSQTSGRKAVGLRPCSHSRSHRQGPAPVMSSGPVSSPHSPVSPPPPPDSPPTECLVGRPWTERLLAIPGRFPGPDSRRRRPARWPVLAALAGLRALRPKPYLPSAKTVNVYRRRRFLSELQV